MFTLKTFLLISAKILIRCFTLNQPFLSITSPVITSFFFVFTLPGFSFSKNSLPSNGSRKPSPILYWERSPLIKALASISPWTFLRNQTALHLSLVQSNYLASAIPIVALFAGRFTTMHFLACLLRTLLLSLLWKWTKTFPNFPITFPSSPQRNLKSVNAWYPASI